MVTVLASRHSRGTKGEKAPPREIEVKV